MAHTPHSTPASKRHLKAIHEVLGGEKTPAQVQAELRQERRIARKRIRDFKTFAERSLPPEKDD